MRSSPLFLNLMRLLSGVVSLLLLLVCIAAVLLGTSFGREWLMVTVAPEAAEQAGYELVVEGVQSERLGDWHVKKLTLAKAQRPMLSITEMELKWQPAALFNRRLMIDGIAADEMEWFAPEKQEANPADNGASQGKPSLFPFEVSQLEIESLAIHHPAFRAQQRFHIAGNVAVLTKKFPVVLGMEINTVSGVPLSATIQTHMQSDQQVEITGSVTEQAGGVLGAMLQQGPNQKTSATFTMSISGANGKLVLDADYRRLPLHMEASGDLIDNRLALHALEISSGAAKASAKGHADFAAETFDVKLESSTFPVSLLRVAGVPVSGKLEGDISASVHMLGAWRSPQLEGSAAFNGMYDTVPLDIKLAGSGGASQMTIDHLKIITLQQGTLLLQGHYAPDAMDMALSVKVLPTQLVSALGWDMQAGTFNADMNIRGTAAQPIIDGTLSLTSDVTTISKEKGKVTVPVKLVANMQTKKDMLLTNMLITRTTERLGNLDLSIPLGTYLRSSISGDALPLKGDVKANMDLSYLRVLLGQKAQSLRGILTADITLDGTLSTPDITGEITLKDGYFENAISGAALHDISGHIRANNTQLTIEHITAHDGAKGRLSLAGIVNWSSLTKGEVALTLNAKDAQLLRRQDMEGIVNGELKLDGNLQKMILSGALDVMPFTVTLDSLLAKEVPEIEVTEVYGVQGRSAKPANDAALQLPSIALDITIKADQQAYLRGQGVEAELQGSIHVKGDLQNSHYAGSFKTVRGSYEVLGKKFILQDGSVRFENNSVSLLIPGVYKNKGMEIRAELSGTMNDLKLRLSSVPPMPQDEIVSHLLLGRSAQNISPFQAIQLANAVNKLRTGGKGLFDPVEATRKLIGVDTISIDSEETETGNGVSVGVGKYINERVYLEVEKSNNPAQPWKGSVEVELLPNLSVESSTGGGSGLGGVELQWKHDY